MVLATRKGGDHMPFGLVSERYGGQILTETPPELRGARGHVICAFLSSWLVLGWFQQRSLVGRLTVLTVVCHWARSLAAAPVGVTACSHWACALQGRSRRCGRGMSRPRATPRTSSTRRPSARAEPRWGAGCSGQQCNGAVVVETNHATYLRGQNYLGTVVPGSYST